MELINYVSIRCLRCCLLLFVCCLGGFVLPNNTRTNTAKKTLVTTNNNVESYDTTKLSKEKKKTRKQQQTNDLKQCGTDIFVWQHQYIKHNAITKTGNNWRAYGQETRRLLSMGIELDKQQHTTKFAQSHFKQPRGEVKTRYDEIKKKFELYRIDQQLKIEEGAVIELPYPIFHMSTIKHVVTDLLHKRGISLDPKETRTIDKYFRHVIKLSKLTQYVDRYDITGFMEHDF